jgi:FeS assembly SUF system protein
MNIDKKTQKEMLIDAIYQQTKFIYDPEIPVSIYDLGMIYGVEVDDDMNIKIIMTLTTPNCPVAESLPQEVKEKAMAAVKSENVEVEVTFDPPWSQEMMSEEAKLELGFL